LLACLLNPNGLAGGKSEMPESLGCDRRVQPNYEGVTSVNAKGNRHFNGKINLIEKAIDLPLRWRKPRRVFVNSMSDLFHRDVPLEFIQRVFSVMNQAKQHTFQVLTKRSKRLLELSDKLQWSENIWMGVSVEDEEVFSRADDLRGTAAMTKWLSIEPLLGPLPSLDLDGIDWVVVGGESGPGSRPMSVDWDRDIRDRCIGEGVPFFFKQWGKLRNNPDQKDPTAKENVEPVRDEAGVIDKKATDKAKARAAKGGRLLDGEVWNEYPQSKQERAVEMSPAQKLTKGRI
jgi:protein gp37